MTVNRARRFELPGIQDLNKSQDAALALPKEGQHLIIGGPGTGKSVIGLLRARHLLEESGEKSYRFLAFNQPLYQSSRHLFGNENILNSETLIRWFEKVWNAAFSEQVPKMKARPNTSYKETDWQSVSKKIDSSKIRLDKRYKLPFLLIDEGQDMPLAFYKALVGLGFEDIYVLADQNQQINPDSCSSRQDIEDVLAIEPEETLELRDNYRNSRPIAQLAHHFYTGDPASPKPNLPVSKPSAVTPELWKYGQGTNISFTEVMDRILQMADRDPRKLIGVITPNNTVRQKFISGLNSAQPILDNGYPPIQTYASGNNQDLDFGSGGIMVINAQACKGLEFEIVILADIDSHQPRQNQDLLMKRFYVMVTRARDQVIMLRCGAPISEIDSLLPSDPNMLDFRSNDDSCDSDDIPF